MFWETFVYLCSERGEAPNAVAELCGVKSSGTVTGWKNGAKPRAAVLRRIADYFGVETSVFSLPTIYVPPGHDYAEKEKTAAQVGDGVNPRYFELSPEDKATVDALIDRLSKAGQ